MERNVNTPIKLDLCESKFIVAVSNFWQISIQSSLSRSNNEEVIDSEWVSLLHTITMMTNRTFLVLQYALLLSVSKEFWETIVVYYRVPLESKEVKRIIKNTFSNRMKFGTRIHSTKLQSRTTNQPVIIQ